ncbi:uncharacterized protein [Venturia canescens]|uniref:uncharacterized protein n=1 Tax=Venturia canescens TaxID=32260 RepID=UPI001C9C85A4|nr:uncharacterized protein LOC122416069 [Venturia canescens]
MVTNGSEEISSGTGWKCRAAKRFEATPDLTLASNRDDNNPRYYRCNLGKVMKECDEASSRPGAQSRFPNSRLESSETSISNVSSIDEAFNAALRGELSFDDMIRMISSLMQARYTRIKTLAFLAINDIGAYWSATDGTHFHRAKVVNKLIGYYLISIAIYIIELCFWTNGKLFRHLVDLLLEPREKTQVLVAVLVAAIFLLVLYLLGGEGNLFASSVCRH